MAFPYSSGDVLTAADLNASSGLVLVSSTAVGSSVSSVDVNNVFSSTFDNYKIIYSNFLTSVANVGIGLRLKTASVDSSSNYYYAGSFVRYTTTGSGFDRSGGATTSFSIGSGDVTASTLSLEMYSPNLSAYTLYATQPTANSSTDGYALTRSGVFRNTTQFTGFRVFLASGTMSGGTIRVYGYNNGV